MKRRDFLKKAGVVTAGGAFSPLMFANAQKSSFSWSMVTSWPTSLDTLYGSAESLAKIVGEMTAGDIKIDVYPAGAQVGGLEVYDAVSSGAFELGHTASYYYIGKDPTHAFFTTVPFGLTPPQINSWMAEAGGQALWDELNAKDNLIAFPAGNTGQQMGGWFNKELNSAADLQGLSFRTAGLGGQVYAAAGVNVQTLPGGELFLALQRGTIDAAEWVGPYDDEILGLNKAAKYYYGPGWQEPGPMVGTYVNLELWSTLPEDVQAVLKAASAATNERMLSRYTSRDPAAFDRLVQAGAEPRVFPDDVLAVLRSHWETINEGLRSSNALYSKVSDSMNAFAEQVRGYDKINGFPYLKAVYNDG